MGAAGTLPAPSGSSGSGLPFTSWGQISRAWNRGHPHRPKPLQFPVVTPRHYYAGGHWVNRPPRRRDPRGFPYLQSLLRRQHRWQGGIMRHHVVEVRRKRRG